MWRRRYETSWSARLLQALLLLYFVATNAFYIPGIYPNDYPQGAELDIRANKLSSSRSNVPYDFYFLPFCNPPEEKNKKLNMGQVGLFLIHFDYLFTFTSVLSRFFWVSAQSPPLSKLLCWSRKLVKLPVKELWTRRTLSS
jgi:hypothetical protein